MASLQTGAAFALRVLAFGLLGIVTFSVPYIKSFYFLKASFSESGINGTIKLGTLGYCLEYLNGTSNVTTCSKPSNIVYQLHSNLTASGNGTVPIPNTNLTASGNGTFNLSIPDQNITFNYTGNNISIPIPQIVNKWLITVLVLHIVAALEALASAVILLFTQHVIGSVVAVIAALITICAFGFDIALFVVAKNKNTSKSITSVHFGSGFVIWFTLGAFFLLLFSGYVHLYGPKSEEPEPEKSNDSDES